VPHHTPDAARTLFAGAVIALLSAGTAALTSPAVGAIVTSVPGITYVANSGNNSVTEYAVGAGGNASPIRTIGGALTGLNGPESLALDASGTLYVSNHTGNSLTEYAAGANGNVAPIRTVTGAATGLNSPYGVALDALGTVHVANNGNDTVTEYAAASTGNVAPIRTVSGSATGLSGPIGVAIDAAGTLYVANISTSTATNSVTEYPSGANGNVAPARRINGAATGLNAPVDLGVDSAGTLYVSNEGGGITEYAGGADGNVPPTRTITGIGTGLAGPLGLALDPAANLYVSSGASGGSVTEYSPLAAGIAPAPLRAINGVATGLNAPFGIVVGNGPSSTPVVLTTAASVPIQPSRELSDVATLSGGSTNPPPGGSITFQLFGPAETGCSIAIFSSTVAVAGRGTYASGQFDALIPGTYRWSASYNGDANNAVTAPGACGDPTETVTVDKYRPTLTTAASAPLAPPIRTITDTATLTGGSTFTAVGGTITFTLFGPGDTLCSTALLTSAKLVDGNGSVTSAPFRVGRPGTYRWRASFSGDANNAATLPGACGDPAETVTAVR